MTELPSDFHPTDMHWYPRGGGGGALAGGPKRQGGGGGGGASNTGRDLLNSLMRNIQNVAYAQWSFRYYQHTMHCATTKVGKYCPGD